MPRDKFVDLKHVLHGQIALYLDSFKNSREKEEPLNHHFELGYITALQGISNAIKNIEAENNG